LRCDNEQKIGQLSIIVKNAIVSANFSQMQSRKREPWNELSSSGPRIRSQLAHAVPTFCVWCADCFCQGSLAGIDELGRGRRRSAQEPAVLKVTSELKNWQLFLIDMFAKNSKFRKTFDSVGKETASYLKEAGLKVKELGLNSAS
jgi:hypothetical protein